MKKISLLGLTVLIITFLLTAGVSGNGESSLNQEYDLVGKRSIEPQFYHMERVIIIRADDGTRQSVEKYNLRLMSSRTNSQREKPPSTPALSSPYKRTMDLSLRFQH